MPNLNVFSAKLNDGEIVLRAGYYDEPEGRESSDDEILDSQVQGICEMHIEPDALICFLETVLRAGLQYQEQFHDIGIKLNSEAGE